MMKRLLLLLPLLCLLLCQSAGARVTTSKVVLSFERTGTDAESVTVSIADSTGAAIEGAEAVLTSTSHDFMETTNAVTESILCPNVNATSSPTITLVFTITGLGDEVGFNKAGLDIHALNSSGKYQNSSDGVVRQWNVDFANGSTTDDVATFGTLDDIDIADGISTDGDTHTIWEIEGDAQTAGDTLVLQLTVTAGSTNKGCFFGLSSIELTQIDDGPLGTGEAYYIRWYSKPTQYVTEESDGTLVTTTQDNTQRQFWSLIPTENENCYYVMNLATGNYMQSTNMAKSTKSIMSTGEEPVEFYIIMDTVESDKVYGYYRFTSTDCDDYDDSSATPCAMGRTSASSNVIVWRGSTSYTASWWKIEETENLYDLHAYDYSSAIGTADYEYIVLSTSGLALTMASDGTLSWEERTDADNQIWYFVGESNLTGTVIVNSGTGLSVDIDDESATLWFLQVSGENYYFRPLATKNEAGTSLTVDGDSIIASFVELPNSYSRASQVYNYPCGATSGSYIKSAEISGDGAVKGMIYPLPKLSSGKLKSTTASAPSTWYSIYTDDKATLAIGQVADLDLTVSYSDGDELYIYYDWNRDGVFETSEQLEIGSSVTAQISVPERAEEGKTRIRLRLTANGLTGAEDDVAGQTLDFVANLTNDAPDEYTITVSVNDTTRGTAEVVSAQDGQAEVVASAAGFAEFVCWQEANVILSVDEDYAFEYSRSMDLVAYFSPNQEIEGISTVGLASQSEVVQITGGSHKITVATDADVHLVRVFTPTGQLVAESTSKVVESSALNDGIFIVKVYLAAGDVAQKIKLN